MDKRLLVNFSVSCLCAIAFGFLTVFLAGTANFQAVEIINSCDLIASVASPLAEIRTQENDLPSLSEIWNSHVGYLTVKWANYLPAYEEELSRLRARKSAITVLELGVSSDGSLQMWKRYFGPESDVVGVMAVDKTGCASLQFEQGITLHCVDVKDVQTVIKNLELRQFDVIIDSSTGQPLSVLAAFQSYFPRLRPGGVYFMENTGSSYESDNFRKQKGAYMESMKDLIDMTNFFHVVWMLKGVPKQITDFQIEVGMWIDSINFQENLVSVRKLPYSKANFYDVLQAGRNFSVGPGNPSNYFNKDLRYQTMRMREIGFQTRI